MAVFEIQSACFKLHYVLDKDFVTGTISIDSCVLLPAESEYIYGYTIVLCSTINYTIK